MPRPYEADKTVIRVASVHSLTKVYQPVNYESFQIIIVHMRMITSSAAAFRSPGFMFTISPQFFSLIYIVLTLVRVLRMFIFNTMFETSFLDLNYISHKFRTYLSTLWTYTVNNNFNNYILTILSKFNHVATVYTEIDLL